MLDSAGTREDTSVIPRLWTADLSGNVRVFEGWRVYGTWNNVTNTQAVTSWRPLVLDLSHPLFLGSSREL